MGRSFAKEVHSGNPELEAQAMGRVLAGAGLLLTAGGLAASGRITGRGPSDPEQRALMQSAGWVPYAYKTENGYVQFNRLDPYAVLFGTIADIWDYSRWAPEEEQDNVETLMWGAAVALANNFTNKSYLTGVKQAVEAISQPDKSLSSALQQYAGAAIPNYIPQSIMGPTEDYMHDVRSVTEALSSRIPGGGGAEPLRNLLGEKVRKLKAAGSESISPWMDAFLPIAYRQVSDDVIANELAELKHGFSPPKSFKGSLDLTSFRSASGQSAYDRWSELHGKVKVGGKTLRQTLTRVIKSDQYQALSPDSTVEVDSPRIAIIKRVVGRYRRAAWAELLREYPELAQEEINQNILEALARKGR